MTSASGSKATGGGAFPKVAACAAIAAILVVAHGVGNAADKAGAVDLGFIAPLRSAKGLADEAVVRSSRDDHDGALRLGRDAVRRMPVEQSVVRKLAEVERSANGSDDWSDEAIAAASLLGWRDSPTQARLLMVSARKGDIEGSIDHVDAVLRRNDVSEQLFAALGQSLVNADIRTALVDRLAGNPPWRGAVLEAVSDYGDAQSTTGFAQVLVELAAREDAELSRSETDPVLSRLAALELDAELVRTAAALEKTTGDRQLLNDRQFAALGDGTNGLGRGPFDWKRGRAQRTVVTVGRGPGGSGDKAVKVSSRSRVTGVILLQNLRLAPGAYTLAYQHKNAASGLSWQVTCGDRTLGSSTPEQGRRSSSDDWSSASLDFTVPAGCPVQRLQLLTGRNLGGNSVEGWFGGLSLSAR